MNNPENILGAIYRAVDWINEEGLAAADWRSMHQVSSA